MITTTNVPGNNAWRITCAICKATVTKSVDFSMNPKDSVEFYGFGWYRLAGQALDAVCPDHFDQLATELEGLKVIEMSEGLKSKILKKEI